MTARKILLIVGGGVAAFKCLDLVRRLKERGVETTAVLTEAAQAFVTPLSMGALSGGAVHTELLSLTAEREMGHIELSRSADLVVVAPATADLMAKMAHGLADDLASTLLLATDKPVLIAPAMNVRMWTHAATQRNLAQLRRDGVLVAGPDEGAMACGEFGPGRLVEVDALADAVEAALRAPGTTASGPLVGRRALVTSGPTHEPIDPVRYIANRSSGRQGVAVAEALAALGAEVTFVTGPAEASAPKGVAAIHAVETAQQMRDAVIGALDAGPAHDIAVFAAAVADWRADLAAGAKIKKQKGASAPALTLVENPDILAEVAARSAAQRPALVIGFAAETDNVAANARAKRKRKGCDWLVANDVSAASGVMGGDMNEVLLITETGEDAWSRASKTAVGERLAARIAEHLAAGTGS
ncbi:MAG: bifunctional phosphopantothenoylcysteine decarboxylase/phosphopantothenate--cysteine ligase CoaBC [Pseudomonadota bacterium]